MMKPSKLLENILRPFTGRNDRGGKKEEDLEAIAAKEQKVFSYEVLVAATKNFNPKHKLGEGGFGPVFKGKLGDGRAVAVKRLGRGSRQGGREFANEAMLLSRVQHKNVVNLHGYCAHDNDLMLVYEYVPNESLDKLLFASEGSEEQQQRQELNWQRRYDIMLGVARGLLYLHEDAHTPIIHRDIKASNILLDDRWVPKIADFGMARLFPEDVTQVNTRVAGTNGYMAPEYLMHGNLSTKADVFSFGVVVLELVSGRKNSDFVPMPNASNLLEWAWKLHKKGRSLDVMDPTLASTMDTEQVAMCIHIGLLCTQSDPKTRPDMRRVVVSLSKKPSFLEEPIRPGVPGSRYRRRSQGPRGSSSYYTSESSSSVNTPSNSASASGSGSTFASSLNTNATTSSTPVARSSSSPLHQKYSLQLE